MRVGSGRKGDVPGSHAVEKLAHLPEEHGVGKQSDAVGVCLGRGVLGLWNGPNMKCQLEESS